MDSWYYEAEMELKVCFAKTTFFTDDQLLRATAVASCDYSEACNNIQGRGGGGNDSGHLKSA